MQTPAGENPDQNISRGRHALSRGLTYDEDRKAAFHRIPLPSRSRYERCDDARSLRLDRSWTAGTLCRESAALVYSQLGWMASAELTHTGKFGTAAGRKRMADAQRKAPQTPAGEASKFQRF